MTIPSYLPEFKGEAGTLRRQAISMAIDRQQIIDNIFFGGKQVAKDFTSPVLDGYSDSLPGNEVLTFNADKAKELWAQADKLDPWPKDKVFTITSNTDGAGNKEYITAMANQISNTLGIKAELNPMPTFKEMRTMVGEKKLTGASRAGWQADYPSLYNFLGPLYGTGAGSNDGDYSSPEFDAKLTEGLPPPASRTATRSSTRPRKSCSRTCRSCPCGTRQSRAAGARTSPTWSSAGTGCRFTTPSSASNPSRRFN